MNPAKAAALSGQGILVLDLYGKNEYSAKDEIDAALASVGSEIRCIRLSHGMVGAAPVYLMIHKSYTSDPRVRSVDLSKDASYTDLILR